MSTETIIHPSPQWLWQSSFGLNFLLHSFKIQGTNALSSSFNLRSPLPAQRVNEVSAFRNTIP